MPPEAQIYTLANGSWLIVGKDICQEISAHYAEGATVRQRVEHLRRLADNLERFATMGTRGMGDGLQRHRGAFEFATEGMADPMTDERGVTREPLTPDERAWATAMERVDSPDLWVGYSVDWRVKAREAEERCSPR